MIDPKELVKAGIKVYKVNQRPREYVCTFFKVLLLLLNYMIRHIMQVFHMDLMLVKLLILYLLEV